MGRYSAKLLFQFRVPGSPEKMRICEERIITYQAKSDKQALSIAKRKGKASQITYRNSEKVQVHWEFVGVMDLVDLSTICGEDEVWYEIKRRYQPMERRSRWIPSDEKLLSHT